LPIHLLIIDDNPNLLRALTRLLCAHQDCVLHRATQDADVRQNLNDFNIQGVLLDHDLAKGQSPVILQTLRKDFSSVVSTTWLMHGALETSQWTPNDLVGVAGILVKPQGLNQLIPWLDQLRQSYRSPLSSKTLKALLRSVPAEPEDPSLSGKPATPFQELEWALKDRGAWNVEIATLLEALEERLSTHEAQVILDRFKFKRPNV
jgi:DNA-binding NarL/FixJ family response regulator